jgi:hypothetical protein
MTSLDQNCEKRKEPRLPLEAPAQISRSQDASEIIDCIIKNISCHGLQAVSPKPLQINEIVVLSFVPENNHEVQVSGIVKWRTNGQDRYRCGVELLQEAKIKLPLNTVSQMMSHEPSLSHDSEISSKQSPLPRCIEDEFLYEIYWGTFLQSFKEAAQHSLAQIGSKIGLSSFYMEDMLPKLSKSHISYRNIEQCHEIKKTLQYANESINHLVRFFRLIDTESTRELISRPKETIQVEKSIKQRIKSFDQTIQSLLISSGGHFHLSVSDFPVVYGFNWQFSKGIDFFLLYTYQSLLFYRAKQLHIILWADDRQVHIDFINDGSKRLKREFIELSAEAPFADSYPARDAKHIGLLSCGLSYLASFNARLQITSEPGNNILSLRLPLHHRLPAEAFQE